MHVTAIASEDLVLALFGNSHPKMREMHRLQSTCKFTAQGFKYVYFKCASYMFGLAINVTLKCR